MRYRVPPIIQICFLATKLYLRKQIKSINKSCQSQHAMFAKLAWCSYTPPKLCLLQPPICITATDYRDVLKPASHTSRSQSFRYHKKVCGLLAIFCWQQSINRAIYLSMSTNSQNCVTSCANHEIGKLLNSELSSIIK